MENTHVENALLGDILHNVRLKALTIHSGYGNGSPIPSAMQRHHKGGP